MKKTSLILIMLSLFAINSYAQKKAAVVSFYGDKIIGFSDLGIGSERLLTDILDLRDNPDFDLAPIMEEFHTAFFNDFAPKFPFELLPEETVTSNQAYIDFEPKYQLSDYDAKNYIVYDGYKSIYEGILGKHNEEGTAAIFKDQADGVMFVEIHFNLEKGFGIGGITSLKMKAYARIAMYDKAGKKVFVINEGANSKKTGVMVKGLPVLSPDKILPMCESALEQLLKDLNKRLPKIIKKAAKKL